MSRLLQIWSCRERREQWEDTSSRRWWARCWRLDPWETGPCTRLGWDHACLQSVPNQICWWRRWEPAQSRRLQSSQSPSNIVESNNFVQQKNIFFNLISCSPGSVASREFNRTKPIHCDEQHWTLFENFKKCFHQNMHLWIEKPSTQCSQQKARDHRVWDPVHRASSLLAHKPENICFNICSLGDCVHCILTV